MSNNCPLQVQYLQYALYNDPVGCFKQFISTCNWEFDTLAVSTLQTALKLMENYSGN